MGKKDKHGKKGRKHAAEPAGERFSADRFGTVRRYIQHVLICTDSKSKNCKKVGPAVLKAFQAAIKARKLQGQIIVSEVSHLGGCKLGPNVIIYPDGVWYGLVDPRDVDEIVDSHLIGGAIVKRLARGSRVGGPCDGCALTKYEGAPRLEPVLA
jgi:(2Fe-2S) ferredoxin